VDLQFYPECGLGLPVSGSAETLARVENRYAAWNWRASR